MAQLYLCPDSDSMYLDLTQDATSPATSREVAPGVWLHLDETGEVVGVEMFRLSQRGGLHIEDLDAAIEGDRLPEVEWLTTNVN
jgi:uncharacterized protein YuzE